MANNNYIYPHVNMTTKAMKRRIPAVAESSATTLLAPFTCDRGPENVLVPVDTIADFERYFGELNYAKEDQRQILNIGKWLSSGGRVLACRITDYKEKSTLEEESPAECKIAACATTDAIKFVKTNAHDNEPDTYIKTDEIRSQDYYVFRWKAKYSGTYYNQIKVNVTQVKATKNLFNVTIFVDDVAVERYSNKRVGQFYTIENTSEFISEITLLHMSNSADNLGEETVEDNAIFKESNGNILANIILESNKAGSNFKSNSWLISTDDDMEDQQPEDYHLIQTLGEILKQPLETPFDTLIDVGYPEAVKQGLLKLFASGITKDNSTLARDDAFLVLTDIVISGAGTRLSDVDVCDIARSQEYRNVALYKQYEKIVDLYSKASGKEVYVPTTYFVAGLYPYNDSIYGPQFPSAGLTRGVIRNSLWIDSIPTNFEKNENYLAGKNYIEKDSRGQYIMTQLTYTDEDTALKFINNSRALLKMKKELTLLARKYLHEFNDRITKTNLLNALNAALSNWIQNRTLSYGSVNILDYTENEFLSNEELLIQLDIKFTGTIEIISTEITVE